MEKSVRFFEFSVALLLILLSTRGYVSGKDTSGKFTREGFALKAQRLQLPFIANEGQMEESVSFYANTFNGTVFVTKTGEIIYSLPQPENRENILTNGTERLFPTALYHAGDITSYAQCRLSEYQCAILHNKSYGKGIILKESFIDGRSIGVSGENKMETTVNYFNGNDPMKWKNGIAMYGEVNLGEIYEGIELRLKAYGNNVEKLFCVKAGADPGQIKVSLSGIQSTRPVFGKEKQSTESHFGKGDIMEFPLKKGGQGVVTAMNGATAAFENGHVALAKPLNSIESYQPNEKETKGLWINVEGQLVAETELGPIIFTKPIAYQEIGEKKIPVEVAYHIKECTLQNEEGGGQPYIHSLKGENLKPKTLNSKLIYGFIVATYDTTRDLIIDPLLASTFMGGSDSDFSNSIAIDTEGNIYVAGTARNTTKDIPTTVGAYDTSHNGHYDVFISKFNSSLTSLLASTFLGGSNDDFSSSIAIDREGNIYVTGTTRNAVINLPATTGAYDTSHNGSYDVFISKFNSSLTSLLASTFLGGSNDDFSSSIAIDTMGNIYVAGTTRNAVIVLPTTAGAYDTSHNGHHDVFISKFNSSLTSLLASTFLGGSDSDFSSSIAIDTEGNIYVTGTTRNAVISLPTTAGAYDTSHNGSYDVFISKFNSSLTSLLASTFLGGSDSDFSSSIAIDTEGNTYVTGTTRNAAPNIGDYNPQGFNRETTRSSAKNLPTTAGAYDTSHNGHYDVFISKFNSSLTSLLASTFLGGSNDDFDSSIAIDAEGNIYVAGATWNAATGLPTTAGAYDTSHNGHYDVFISRFNGSLTSLLASTFLGGSDSDFCNSIAIDTERNVYVTGTTWDAAANLPATAGAYTTSHNGSNDVFISRFNGSLTSLLAQDN